MPIYVQAGRSNGLYSRWGLFSVIQLVTIEQTCQKYNIKERTLRNLRKQHGFPKPIKIGGALRFVSEEIDLWAKSQREDVFVTHIGTSGSIACRLLKPNIRTRLNGKNYAVFQTFDDHWHVYPFMTHVIVGIDEGPIELSCQDWETPEIDWADVPAGATIKLSFDGDY